MECVEVIVFVNFVDPLTFYLLWFILLYSKPHRAAGKAVDSKPWQELNRT